MKTKEICITVIDSDTEEDHEKFAELADKLREHQPLTDDELELLKQEYLEGAVAEIKDGHYSDANGHLNTVILIENIQLARQR